MVWEIIASAVASSMKEPDAPDAPSQFFGGDTSWGGTWAVATSGSKANATSTPSAGMDSWLIPVALIAGAALLAVAFIGKRK